jgi:pimeloyl-ACP methyl ester carboxylesterase
VLRARYQFWFYLYPTGPGYLQAAAELRRDLAQLRAELDPHCSDPCLGDMVLVGHSMGGLVSRLLTVDSGEDFWQLVSHRPLAELPLDTPARDELQQLFYFQQKPCVRRVVFIATPHRGSLLSPSFAGQLAADLVQAPRKLMDSAQDLVKASPGVWGALGQGRVPTSVDLLAPGSPALQLLASRPRPAGVHFHSIVGQALPHTLLREITRPIVGNEKTDGVVPYSSAHLEAAESEVVVPADHMHVHHHPLAVQEVRRILLEHLRERNQVNCDTNAAPHGVSEDVSSAAASGMTSSLPGVSESGERMADGLAR